MPIRGDRLRWPPRPGKKFSDASGPNATRRSLSTDDQPDTNQPLRQPDERDESSDRQTSRPREVIKQAHDDIESGQQDTDCRNNASQVPDRTERTTAPQTTPRRPRGSVS